MSTFKQRLSALVASLPDDATLESDALTELVVKAEENSPSEQEAQAADIATWREFKAQREANPFRAAQLLEDAGTAAIERGRVLDTEPPSAA